MAENTSEVVPLSRFRAALARARKGHRADALLADPAASQLVPQLPVQELYYAITEVGLADARELYALCTPEQIQGFIDLDCWSRDHIDEHRMHEWIDALVDAGAERVRQVLGELDPELVSLYLLRYTRVYDLTLGDPIPDEPEGQFFPTPDSFFLIDVLPGGELGKSVARMIDLLYRADLDFARTLLVSTRPQLASDLEETAYRFRSGRMADLGHVDFYEALEAFRFLDPASVRIDEGKPDPAPPLDQRTPADLPPQLATALPPEGLFTRALQEISDPAELERLQSALLMLLNQVLSADRTEPGDVAAAQTALRRTAGYLGLGLDYLAKGEAARAAVVLGQVSLSRVHRVGFSLTLQLQRLAATLLARGFVRLTPEAPLLYDGPWAEAITQLSTPRPAIFALREVAVTAARLDEAARIGPLVSLLAGATPDEIADIAGKATQGLEQVRFGTIVRTLAAQALLGRPGRLSPLHPRELRQLARFIADGALTAEARRTVDEVFASRLGAVTPPAGFAEWMDLWLRDPSDVLVRFSWLR